MKLKSFFTSVLATLALAVGCTQELIPSLKEISVTPSYFTMEVEGGNKELTVVSTGDWKITDIPDGMTVTPSSGSASPEGTKVIVNVNPTTDESVKTVYLKLVCGNETQLISITQKAFIPAFPAFVEGDYWIVCKDQALKPVEGSSYGYLYAAPVNVGEDGKVTSSADNVFTFKAVEGGYTIQDKNDMYYYLSGTYNSFNIAAEMPSSGAVWTVEQIADDAFQIANASNGKVMQYSVQYTSAGAYDAIDPANIMPFLVKVEGEPEPEPEPELGDPSSIADIVKPAETAVIEGVVTGVCTSGVILTDETASIFAYKIGSDLELGDKVKVQGALADYQYGYQLKAPYTTKIISNGNAIEYPVATEITEANVASLIPSDKMLAKYVTVKGKVTLDTYGNALISVGDYKVKTYYGASDAYTEYDGKGIELSGYFVSYKETSKELNVLVTVAAPFDLPAEGGDEGGEGGEESTVTQISSIVATTEEPVTVEGIVTALTTNGAVITDASGSIFAYKLSGVNIQDKVKISAKVGQFNKGFQLACDGVSAEVLSSGNAITYPPVAVSTESDLTAIVAPDLFLAQYATVQGKVTTDSHNNAIISVGSQTVKSYYGTVSYADYAGKTVEMSGYVVSYKSPTVSMVVTSIKEIAGGEEGGEEGGEGENPGAGGETGGVVTYQHIFNAKPAVGDNVDLSGASWNVTATNLNNYNSQNYAGVQFGTSSKSGSITLTSSAAWAYTKDATTVTQVKEIRLWLNCGGGSVTPSVTIGGTAAISDGKTVTKNNSAGSDWTQATKVTFTPASDGNTGVIVIDVTSEKAGYICAIEIDAE